MLVLLLTITSENWCFQFQSLEKFFVLVFSLPRISAVPYISLAFTLFSIAYYLKYNHYLSSVEAKCNLNIGLVEIYFVTKNYSWPKSRLSFSQLYHLSRKCAHKNTISIHKLQHSPAIKKKTILKCFTLPLIMQFSDMQNKLSLLFYSCLWHIITSIID